MEGCFDLLEVLNFGVDGFKEWGDSTARSLEFLVLFIQRLGVLDRIAIGGEFENYGLLGFKIREMEFGHAGGPVLEMGHE